MYYLFSNPTVSNQNFSKSLMIPKKLIKINLFSYVSFAFIYESEHALFTLGIIIVNRFEDLSMSLNELIKQKRSEIISLAEKYGAYNIRIFGSVARGQENEDSDIDFLVDLRDERSLWDLGGLWMELNDLLKVRIEVFTENTLKDSIRRIASKEAITL